MPCFAFRPMAAHTIFSLFFSDITCNEFWKYGCTAVSASTQQQVSRLFIYITHYIIVCATNASAKKPLTMKSIKKLWLHKYCWLPTSRVNIPQHEVSTHLMKHWRPPKVDEVHVHRDHHDHFLLSPDFISCSGCCWQTEVRSCITGEKGGLLSFTLTEPIRQ